MDLLVQHTPACAEGGVGKGFALAALGQVGPGVWPARTVSEQHEAALTVPLGMREEGGASVPLFLLFLLPSGQRGRRRLSALLGALGGLESLVFYDICLHVGTRGDGLPSAAEGFHVFNPCVPERRLLFHPLEAFKRRQTFLRPPGHGGEPL